MEFFYYTDSQFLTLFFLFEAHNIIPESPILAGLLKNRIIYEEINFKRPDYKHI